MIIKKTMNKNWKKLGNAGLEREDNVYRVKILNPLHFGAKFEMIGYVGDDEIFHFYHEDEDVLISYADKFFYDIEMIHYRLELLFKNNS